MRSFTLVEIMVALVIFALLIAAFGIFGVGNRAYETDAHFLNLQQSARKAMNLMVRELRETNNVPAGGNLTFNSPTDIAFNIIVPGPVVVWTGIRYFLDGNAQIIRQDFAAGTQSILARNIANLIFTPQPPGGPIQVVVITITAVDLQRPGPADDLQFFLRERVSLRN